MMEMTDAKILYCKINEQGHIESRAELLCSWYAKTVRTIVDKNVLTAQAVMIRAPVMPFVPRVGDMVINAPLPESVVSDAALKRAGGLTIKAVSDNRRGEVPHWKMEAV